MKRSAIRESLIAAPDFASLHPGYGFLVKQSSSRFAESRDGLLRGTCHRARIRATHWLAMTI
jgi:hypothetical protein